MVLTNDPAKIKNLFGDFFDDIIAVERLNNGFQNLDKVIGISYSNPEIKFLLECRKDKVKFIPDGDGTFKPDVTIIMNWETAHKFWMGELDTISALFDQRIKVKGDAASLLVLKPLFDETSEIYKRVFLKHFGQI
ncbi:MAG: SCP2 sterol-binding domain-containing protein [bacterium]